MGRISNSLRVSRAPRTSLWLGASLLFASSALACSAILGFEERTLDPNASGADASNESSTDGAASDGKGDAPVGSPSAPVDVIVAPVPVLGNVTTLAGSGTATWTDGTGAMASFNHPYGIAVSPVDGNVYVADGDNHRIRKLTVAGIVTTFAGSGVGGFADSPTPLMAQFNIPGGLAFDKAGSLYVPEFSNNRVRKVSTAGVVTTHAGSGAPDWVDGAPDIAAFNQPLSVAGDGAGNSYVADYTNHRIRKVSPLGVVSTLAGSGVATFADGTGDQASFNSPAGIAVTASGDVYVSDNANNRIRKITSAGVVTTFAGSGTPVFGDGVGTAAGINKPTGIAWYLPTGDIYFNDSGNAKVRRITPAGVVTTLAGDDDGFADGMGTAAKFRSLQGMAVDPVGQIYIADYNNHRIRKLFVLGVGRLAVSWTPPQVSGASDILSYTATATAPGRPTKTCTSMTIPKCTIGGLTTAAAYSVSVTATNVVGAGAASAVGAGTPN